MKQTLMIKCLHFDRIFDLHHRKVWKRLQKVYFRRLNLKRVTMTLPNFQKKPETTSRNRWVPVRKFISHIWTILTKFPTLLCFPFFFENLSFLPNHDFLLRVLSFVWKNRSRFSLLSYSQPRFRWRCKIPLWLQTNPGYNQCKSEMLSRK